MAESHHRLDHLVTISLAFDTEKLESAFEEAPWPSVVSALTGAFTAAAQCATRTMDDPARHDFFRRVAASSNGEVQAWMVDAAFRLIDGDPDTLAGIKSDAMTATLIDGLRLLTTDYLTSQQAQELLPVALEQAHQLQPILDALPIEQNSLSELG
ncbi:hypothetical protein [Kineosporia sp. NBRC 101731]|uniref:hypothetical protein n=1 Tax=Kineosporia sp. NBRC 101731 TaxID=3032199 RepID=UPI0024A0934F|nr:hypothetical protein [Kineosporia sp. NBRC 101731]GLY32529.1 hypothetical protein Kisp02_58940 [Kineosporia sp. NBRC 101731]